MKLGYVVILPLMLAGFIATIVLLRNSILNNGRNYRRNGNGSNYLDPDFIQTDNATSDGQMSDSDDSSKAVCRIPSNMDPFHWQIRYSSLWESKHCVDKLECTEKFHTELIESIWNPVNESNFIRKSSSSLYRNWNCYGGRFNFENDNSVNTIESQEKLTERFVKFNPKVPEETGFMEVICKNEQEKVEYQNVLISMPNLEQFKQKMNEQLVVIDEIDNDSNKINADLSIDSINTTQVFNSTGEFKLLPSQTNSITNSSNTESTSHNTVVRPIRKPSVLILAVESLSRLNFIRNMPETKKAFEELGNVFYMKGLTRIADNTFPNMIAFTTGNMVEDYDKVWNDGPYDQFPFIWRQYEASGYPTALIDDDPPITRSTFNYLAEGFRRPPTTFYPHPFWVYWRSKDLYQRDYCLDWRQPIPKVLLDQVEQFQRHCQFNSGGLPYFILSMNIFVMHECWSNARLLDNYYADYLTRAKKSGLLNDTVVIMMGDHGDRFSVMLQTEYGKLESRLPLFAIHLPDSLLKLYPEFGDNLLYNRKRLSTVLDMHRMLEQISQLNLDYRLPTIPDNKPIDEIPDKLFVGNTNKRVRQPGEVYSPITEQIPIDRTDIQARIPSLYSVCDTTYYQEIKPELAEEVAQYFVYHLNKLLPKELCQPLRLSKVVRALVADGDGWWYQKFFGDRQQQIELTVQVAPSGALLRTTLQKSMLTSWTKITKNLEIERLNLYGNQSHCIADRVLRKYCICKDIQGAY